MASITEKAEGFIFDTDEILTKTKQLLGFHNVVDNFLKQVAEKMHAAEVGKGLILQNH